MPNDTDTNAPTQKIRSLWLLLACQVLGSSLSLASEPTVGAEDCLVVIMATTPTQGRPGTGFVIGDGTLVATAYHVVAEASGEGQHRMLGVIKVLSPYLGQCCYADPIAVNKQRDLVVLRIPWQGHPAFEVADDQALLEASDLETIGMLPIVSAIPAETDRPFPPALTLGRDILEIDFIAVRQRIPQFVSLSGRGQLGPGWSGAPMIIPGTLKVGGCFTRLNKSVSDGRMACQGPALTQVKQLIANSENAQSLTPSRVLLTKAADGYTVTRLFLEAHKALIRDNYEKAQAGIEELLTLRPQTPAFHVLAGQLQEKQKHYDEAEAHYQAALDLDPQTPIIRMIYGQFLLEQDPAQGVALLESLWGHAPMRPWIILIMWNYVQREATTNEHYTLLLEQALDVEPDNAYLWLNLGATQLQRGQKDKGFQSMTKAVELFPERSSLRGQLAHLLENDGRLDEAQKHFRRLLDIEPQNPVVYFWYARFLAQHRPQLRFMALEAAHKALSLPPRGGLAQEDIEKLIEEIRQATPQWETPGAESPSN